MFEIEPVLYILMRTDLNSMNPGKGMAQAVHAGHAFVNRIQKNENSNWNFLYDQWSNQLSSYKCGTTIVLDGICMDEIEALVERATDLKVCADVFEDDTYPLQDGDFIHLIPLKTCGYIFIDKLSPEYNELRLWELELHA